MEQANPFLMLRSRQSHAKGTNQLDVGNIPYSARPSPYQSIRASHAAAAIIIDRFKYWFVMGAWLGRAVIRLSLTQGLYGGAAQGRFSARYIDACPTPS
jgi:hypothetical protein